MADSRSTALLFLSFISHLFVRVFSGVNATLFLVISAVLNAIKFQVGIMRVIESRCFPISIKFAVRLSSSDFMTYQSQLNSDILITKVDDVSISIKFAFHAFSSRSNDISIY